MLFPAFEAAFFAFYSLNDGKEILTDDRLLEEGRSIQAAQGMSENDLRILNGWLRKFKTRHGIHQHMRHGGADSGDRDQLAVNLMIGQYPQRNAFNFDESDLFYRLRPNKTLESVKRNSNRSENDRIS